MMFRICFLTALVCVSAAPLGFLQEKRDVDNTQAAVASADVVSELGATDGEAPADYVAPEVAEDDESEDVEEKVADDSEEGVADEDDSEAPSGATGGASLLQAEPADVTAGDAPADYAEPKVDDSEDSDDSEEAAPKDEEDAAEAQADSFLQIDDVDNTKVADVDGSANEHGDTDGEAPADYVAPLEVADEDDSEDAEEKVDDDSEEGVADEESEEVSGPTGAALLQKDVDDSESEDNVEDSTDGGAVPEDEENVDAANDDKEAGTGEEDGAESFLQVASKGSDDYSDADDEEDESNDSTELSSVLKDGTDDIEQGFDLDEDDAAVIADDESEEDVEALESEEEDSADDEE